jgi:NADPH2 dehydrogenase
MTVTTPKLFTSAKVGDVTLQHRIVMAPLTRNRATKEHVPTDLMVEYYAQRASTPGTLLISEATAIAPQAVGYAHIPGIWNEEQVTKWKRVSSSQMYLPKPCESQ